MTLWVLLVKVSWYWTQLLMINLGQVRVRSLCYVHVHSSSAVLSSPFQRAGVSRRKDTGFIHHRACTKPLYWRGKSLELVL